MYKIVIVTFNKKYNYNYIFYYKMYKLYDSTRADKKFMVITPNNKKIHFGQVGTKQHNIYFFNYIGSNFRIICVYNSGVEKYNLFSHLRASDI